MGTGRGQWEVSREEDVQRVPENAWMHSKLTRCQKRISRMRQEPRSQPEQSLSVLGTLLRLGNMEVSESRTKSRKKWRRVSVVLVEKESRPNPLSECIMIIFSLVQLITLCLVHLNFGCKWFCLNRDLIGHWVLGPTHMQFNEMLLRTLCTLIFDPSTYIKYHCIDVASVSMT